MDKSRASSRKTWYLNIDDRTQYYSDEYKENEMQNTRVW